MRLDKKYVVILPLKW